ncbi:MAG: primosomal protein N' [Saprospiraceae bacterium]|nr:primosomal protein N' [Saprospiraceae bacterium]
MPNSQIQHYHPTLSTMLYVEVVIPLAIPKLYTYAVPEEMVNAVQFGVRAEVQFGKNKLYAAIIVNIHRNTSNSSNPKPILSILDDEPVITPIQFKLCQWIANYYCCTIGEVMNAALPSNLKLTSETQFILSPLYDETEKGLSEKEIIVLEALRHRTFLSIADIRDLLEVKTVYPLVKGLLEKRLLYLKEDLQQKYQPKKVACIRLQSAYEGDESKLQVAFELLQRSTKQTMALLAYVQLAREQPIIRKQDLYNAGQKLDSNVLNAIVEKGIFEYYEQEVSRISGYEDDLIETPQLSEDQTKAVAAIEQQFQSKEVVLLHGVTGSGKTRVFVELMQEMLAQGKQVLYLLPEIALTTQLIQRLQRIFGDQIVVYHSRLNDNERVEVWKKVAQGHAITMGARSSVFLPFQQLGMVIVDEEHDSSFKQQDPNPRYQGRDVAIYLSKLHQAKVLLGTATPSVESYQNAIWGKYGLVEMKTRFGGLELPASIVIDLAIATKQQKMNSLFSSDLIHALQAAIERKEQIILFQNRRGYAPVLHCETCGWHQECVHCDVSLTYHKFQDRLRCHYCGFNAPVPEACPACGLVGLSLKGFGTEKIEDEIKIFLPEARIARMDLDTVQSKRVLNDLINDFEERRIDILVGTQMVTKGLDFENVGIVGVLNADSLFQFPDFRASERGFQLITQVSGRAGRKHKQGKVYIQTYTPQHPVIQEVLDNDFQSFFTRETAERKQFGYPPYVRLIRVTLKHKRPEVLNHASRTFENFVKPKLGEWIIGPAIPYVGRVRGYYLLDFLIKLEREPQKITYAKKVLLEGMQFTQTQEGFSGVRVHIDVDPY